MNVQVKSSNGITIVPIETRLLANRRIFIEGNITAELACDFARQVVLLMDEDSNAPIDLFISSPGGGVAAGLLMYDVIRSLGDKARAYCLGTAYSMAAVLFAGAGGGRFMLPNSELMIHQPLLSGGVGGNASTVKSISDSLLESMRKLNAILSKHTGRSLEEIEAATRFDHFFSPEESIAFGLADELIDFAKVWEVTK